MGDEMPARSEVDPLFDGHLERGLLDLTPTERLDWIWTGMQLLRLARTGGQDDPVTILLKPADARDY
jgi:hypothetical protein